MPNPLIFGTIFDKQAKKLNAMRWFVCLIFMFGSLVAANGQNPALLDSVESRLRLLTELTRSENFERAQVEAEDFRWFIRRERLIIPAKAISAVSNVYRENKDEKSALKFLEEAELSARRERDIERKAALLRTIIKEYEHWEIPEKALDLQRQLAIAQDSLASRKVTAEMLRWRKQLDSLQALRQTELSSRSNLFELDRDRAYTLGGVVVLVLLALLAANFISAERWRKRLEYKELELDLLRSTKPRNDQPLPPPTHDFHAPVVAEQAAPRPTVHRMYANLEHDGEPAKTALIIEPNRQIVLYLKSLLSDDFEVETAQTANEGIQLAGEILPDLIVCDAVLNGKTGIETVRQIKFSERTNHIPVILLTEKSGNEGRLDALRAGAETWFTRPLLDVEMETQVKSLLNARKVKQEQFARALHLYFTENRLELDSSFLTNTLHLVEQRLPDPDFTPDELARKSQLSNTLFHKKLRVLTGKDPAQLIREMRLEKAKMLVEKRAAPVQTIAELVGFTNAGTFSLAFKEYFGENTMLLQQNRSLN
ncbi:MAG: response regulator [Saprospiraceae bacterium]